jgi:hypothetical protein
LFSTSLNILLLSDGAAVKKHQGFGCALWVISGHVQCTKRCPLCANSGHPQKDLRDKERPPRGGLSESDQVF